MSKNNKINILFLIDWLRGGGGTERHLSEVVSRLNKDKFKSFICTFDSGAGLFLDRIKKIDAEVEIIDVGKFYTINAFIKAFRLRRFIKENDIDIVQTFHFKSDTYGVLVSKLAGVSKIISSRRDTGDLKQSKHLLLNKVANKLIDQYIMVCDAVGSAVVKNEGVSYDKMMTIYNGVDLKRFSLNGSYDVLAKRKELEIGENDFVVGTAAIFRPEKAYHIFFDGIEKVGEKIKDLKVIILGGGILKEQFENYSKEKGLSETVSFLGYVPEVERYLPIMDLFCLVPNKNEGFSNAILEAMAIEKPVIATDVGGNAELVIDGETGLIIPADDTNALSDAILKLYKDKSLRELMGKKGRERIENKFTIQHMISKMEKLYINTQLSHPCRVA